MQRESVLLESLREHVHHASRIVFVGEDQDGVVGIADQRR